MYALRPIVIAIGASFLQACMTTPNAKGEIGVFAPTQTLEAGIPIPLLSVYPVVRVQHSANQSAATFYQLGKYHLERGNLEFARSAYEASITLDGQQLDARNALAALDATQGKLDSAKALLIQIVADFPDAAHPHNNLGYVYYLQRNFEDAQRNLQRAIALDPGNERARNNLDAVNMAISRNENRETAVLAVGQTLTQEKTSAIISEPVTVDAATPATSRISEVNARDATQMRTQGLAIISPPLVPVLESVEPQSRMEVVQIVPNIFELRLKQPNLISSSIFLASAKIAKPVTDNAVTDVLTNLQPKASHRVSNIKNSRIEVANGNGITGMAKRISNVLNLQGISVSRLSNERPYKQLETKIQYRAGYETAASNLKNALKGHATAVLTPSLSANLDIRLLLGKDAITHIASMESPSDKTLLAFNVQAD